MKEINSLSELELFAAELSPTLPKGRIIGFSGNLGAGKTTLIAFLSKCLGYSGQVLSPTYTLEHIYNLDNDISIHHWDLYRLHEDRDAEPILELVGLQDRYIFVEWPEKISKIIAHTDMHLYIELIESDRRIIRW